MSKRIAVILSGCGVFDGSEIHEATLTLLALDRANAQVVCAAPAVSQMHVIDHQEGAPTPDTTRDVITESARIARGPVLDVAELNANELDAVIIPGGFGAAKNLCDFAVAGSSCTVQADVERVINDMFRLSKPMGFICIAPVIAARVLGGHHPVLTIGNDPETAMAIEAMGARHVVRAVDEISTDEKLKIVTTPAYMLGPSISAVASGIDQLVHKVLDLS